MAEGVFSVMSDDTTIDQSASERAARIEAALAAIELRMSEQDGRVALIEQRLEEQEYSVRRVLDLLIGWLEGEPQPTVDRQDAA